MYVYTVISNPHQTIDILTPTPPRNAFTFNTGKLDSSFRIDATATKGELAQGIAQELARVFVSLLSRTWRFMRFSIMVRTLTASYQDRPNIIPVAFKDNVLCKEADFKDLFLINLVQRAEGVFQPTIAVRVPT